MDTSKEDQPIAEARANISKLHNAVQLLRRVYFLTSRGTREAAVVPVDLGELIQRVGGPDNAVAILKAHLKHPQPALIHRADCTMPNRKTMPVTVDEARVGLDKDPDTAACEFCAPETSLDGRDG